MKKYDLEKNKIRLQKEAPGYFEGIVLIISIINIALSMDFDLTYLGGVSCSLFLCMFMYCLLWLIDVIIYLIIRHKRKKKEGVNNED